MASINNFKINSKFPKQDKHTLQNEKTLHNKVQTNKILSMHPIYNYNLPSNKITHPTDFDKKPFLKIEMRAQKSSLLKLEEFNQQPDF